MLAAYLDRCLLRPDFGYDQPTVTGAPAYADSVLHGDWPPAFRRGDLWLQWFQDAAHLHGDEDISPYLGGIRLICAVINECATTCPPWLCSLHGRGGGWPNHDRDQGFHIFIVIMVGGSWSVVG
ncbi:DUF6000 family protein [Streptomyces sp. LaBMicrA B280]|uniref:DUF6000 family protein n=1 Tax=Streptomyces sp. LaBMicrA B280 TaxID=3391001 RepID=UPI003BA7593D